MTRLFASELLRLTSRRMVRVLAVIAATGIVIGNVIGGVHSSASDPLVLANLADLLKGTSFFLMVIGLMIGSSSVGADWEQATIGRHCQYGYDGLVGVAGLLNPLAKEKIEMLYQVTNERSATRSSGLALPDG